MTRTHTIHAAILGEHGNCDEQYPRPLTCGECGDRPKFSAWFYDYRPSPTAGDTWYVTESDPLPDGWMVIYGDTHHHRFTLCPRCYADHAEPREEEEIGY